MKHKYLAINERVKAIENGVSIAFDNAEGYLFLTAEIKTHDDNYILLTVNDEEYNDIEVFLCGESRIDAPYHIDYLYAEDFDTMPFVNPKDMDETLTENMADDTLLVPYKKELAILFETAITNMVEWNMINEE